jgi:hypothetical protein
MVRTRWLAALSDGTVAIEGIAPFEEIENELSPWQKLLAHLDAKGLYITGMRIQVFKCGEPARTYNLPSYNKTPKGNHEKWVTLRPRDPLDYSYRRWVTRSLTTKEERHHIEVRAEYASFSVSLFVDEDEGNESWVVVH